MSPAAYSLGATPPLKREERDQQRTGFPFSRRAHQPSSPAIDTADDQLALTAASPVKRGFFQRLAGGGGAGKKGEVGDGSGGTARVPWETTNSREHGRSSVGPASAPTSPTRTTKAARQHYPRPSNKEQEDHRRLPSPLSSPFSTTHSTRRPPYRHHQSRSSDSSSTDEYSLFGSGMGTIQSQSERLGGYGTEDDLEGGGNVDEASLSPSKYGSGGKKGLRSLVKKGSKFSLRSLVYAGSGGTGGGESSPPGSPSHSFTFGTAGTSPHTPSLSLAGPSSPSHHLHLGRRPSFPPPRSAQAAYYPREISAPSSSHRPPPIHAGGAFLTPLPSPSVVGRERKTSAASVHTAPAQWMLGAAGGGEDELIVPETPAIGSVRGKAARVLGEEVVPSGKAAKVLGMERKKTLVKKPSVMSLTADSFDYGVRRPSVAPSLSATITSYGSPSFPSTPRLEDTLAFSSSPLRRRFVSANDVLLTPSEASVARAERSPSPPAPETHRNLYDDSADEEPADWWRPPSPPSYSPPRAVQSSLTLPPQDRSFPFPPTFADADSSPRARSTSTSSGYSAPSQSRRQIRTTSASTRSSTYHHGSDSPERVLSYVSSSYGIPSQFFPFQVSPPPGSPTHPYPTPTATPGDSAGFTVFPSNPRRLSPESIRFSALGMQMSPDAFGSPSSYSLAGSSTRTSVLGDGRGGGSSSSRSKRPSLGPRGYSASSVLSSTGSAAPQSPSSPPSPRRTRSYSRSSSSGPSSSTSLPGRSQHPQMYFPTPPTSPPPPIPSAQAKMARSNTLASVASSHTKKKQRSHALQALEGRGGHTGKLVGDLSGNEGRRGRNKALEQRGLKGLREEEAAGGASSGISSGSSGSGAAAEDESRTKDGVERRRLAPRESRPFLNLDYSSSDDEEESAPAVPDAQQPKLEEPQRQEPCFGRQRDTISSDRRTTSSTSSSRATSVAPSGPPPTSPLPPSPFERSRPPSILTATTASSGQVSSAATIPPSFTSLSASPPPPPRSTSLNKLPPPPDHPYARPLSPSASPLPTHSTSSPRQSHHNRDVSAASDASISPRQSVFPAVPDSPASSDGFSVYSTLEATANAFPAPPSSGLLVSTWDENEENGVEDGAEEYRFPALSSMAEDKAASFSLAGDGRKQAAAFALKRW